MSGKTKNDAKPEDGNRTEFFGSQVGGKSVINYSYTDHPWRLVAYDIRYFFTFAWALPWIVWPLRPCDGGHFDELSSTPENIKCICIHVVLFILQLVFIIALPIAFLLPVYLFIAALGVFFLINWLLCLVLNGKTTTYESDPRYAPALPEHQHEQWIFLNGVAVGETWLKGNINRLALTFKRPVLGIHNTTTGIIFDVIECLIQRNFGYATGDVRLAYKVLKEKLYNPQYSKVVFILHSQGCIEGGLVLDWLLQELPQDLLAKLEVYTFGSAANHFNNPHRHVESQKKEQKHPNERTMVSETTTDIPVANSPIEMKAPPFMRRGSRGSEPSMKDIDRPQPPTAITNGTTTQARRTYTTPACDRAIRHVEHYAHTTDFVALWGLLHFVTNERASPEMPRFIGRVFSRVSTRGGHQLSQHYLNGMFPLVRNEQGEFIGCADSNDFMESVVELGKQGTEQADIREGVENSWAMLGLASDSEDEIPSEVEVRGSFHGSFHGSLRGRLSADERDLFNGTVKVKHLSRLWQYRNGRRPSDAPRRPNRGFTL